MRPALFLFALLALPQMAYGDEARRLAVYDAFVDRIATNYYDPTFAGIDWPAIRAEGRAKAAAVDDAHLYSGVLYPITRAFRVSHIMVLEPLPDHPVPLAPEQRIQAIYETRTLAGGVRYVRFDIFSETDIDRVLAVIDSAGKSGLILDLSHNHGGSANAQQRLLDRLLPGNTAYGRNRGRAGEQVMRTDWFGKHYNGRLVVLIGPESASAAEITAAALKGRHGVTLIGGRTSGSVLNAVEFPLPDGGAVQVPVGDFTAADSARIEGVGVKPDIVAAEDTALDRAVSILGER